MRAMPLKTFVRVGQHPCLDFINTQMIQNGVLVDLFEEGADVVAWLVQVHVLDASQAEEGLRKMDGHRDGRRLLTQARTLRTALREMVERIVDGRSVQEPTIKAINELLRYRLGYPELIRVSGGFERRMRAVANPSGHFLSPVAEFATDLLCFGDLSLIKKCRNPACVLYFCDTTKNHARHWCSMALCGNRMKAASHYRRTRKKN